MLHHSLARYAISVVRYAISVAHYVISVPRYTTSAAHYVISVACYAIRVAHYTVSVALFANGEECFSRRLIFLASSGLFSQYLLFRAHFFSLKNHPNEILFTAMH